MSMVTEVEKMADNYISEVFNIDENSLQYKDLKQTFIMGMWAFLNLSKHKNFTADTFLSMEAEIIVYHKARIKELGFVLDDEYYTHFFKN